MEKLTNFINGIAVESQSGETTSLINPATGVAFATAPNSNSADIDAACTAASNAFGGWRDSTPSQRQRALLRIADAIEDRQKEIIEIDPGEQVARGRDGGVRRDLQPVGRAPCSR